MPFSRSTTSYFHRDSSHRTIQEVADQESLVIYAGAGVSIDRTGMSWRELMSRLMEDHIQDNAVRQSLMEIYTPQQAASVVCQMYSNRFPANSIGRIRDKLRALLYAEQVWQRGALVTAIVNLAAACHDHGKRVYLVTTNYDSFLEEEVDLLDEARQRQGKNMIAWQPVAVDYEDVGDPTKMAAEKDRCVDGGKIVHLHGYVPEIGENGGGRFVLSELDYFESQALATDILTDLFRENAALVVGASLTDPPLLNALARSKQTGPAGSKVRVAVMPLQGVGPPRLPFDDTHAHRLALEYVKRSSARMAQFGLKGTFPDFYCQVPQLLTEVQIAVERCSSPNASYASSSVRYGLRLTNWWKSWNDPRKDDLINRQSSDHHILRDALKIMVEALDAQDEIMKLEMWLRWEPETKRQLRLWASSTGTWSDFKSMRIAEIGADSRYVSVRAFCLGRPEIYPTEEDENSRWRTHLCVPVRIHGGRDDFPVGVISLASMSRSARYDSSDPSPVSRIGVWNGAQVARVVTMLRKIGAAVAATKPVPSNEVTALLDTLA